MRRNKSSVQVPRGAERALKATGSRGSVHGCTYVSWATRACGQLETRERRDSTIPVLMVERRTARERPEVQSNEAMPPRVGAGEIDAQHAAHANPRKALPELWCCACNIGHLTGLRRP